MTCSTAPAGVSESTVTTVTTILQRLAAGDDQALEQLLPLLYTELHAIAGRQLRSERAGHTLSPTALVNEAYLKLARRGELAAADRTSFLAVAATTMRRVLIDYARTRRRVKRGGGEQPIPLDDVIPFLSEHEADELLALDDALTRLESVNPRGSQVVHYRFFGGLTLDETADVLKVSVKTVQRSWISARAWLRKEVHVALSD